MTVIKAAWTDLDLGRGPGAGWQLLRRRQTIWGTRRTRYPAPTHSDIVIKVDKLAAIKTLCATFHSLTEIYSLLAIATSFDLENGLSPVFISGTRKNASKFIILSDKDSLNCFDLSCISRLSYQQSKEKYEPKNFMTLVLQPRELRSEINNRHPFNCFHNEHFLGVFWPAWRLKHARFFSALIGTFTAALQS